MNLIQETYKCDECINSNGSEMPQSLLPHSYFLSTILAKVAELKFNLALPFHRQIKLWQAIGLQVNARLLAANIIKVSQTYLEPLYDYLQGLVKKEPIIHMDETPFKVIDESNGNGYFGVTRSTKEFSKHQTTMFHYYSTRAGKTVGQILGQQYSGVIICNGYGYSDRLYPRAKFGSCCSYST